MAGSAVTDDWEVTTNETRTLVLLGRTVTSTCELQSTRLDDGQTIDVIDTPGLVDFSELAAVQTFREFFGEKIGDYMVIVFTGGDELEDSDQSLDEYLGNDCPEPLKETIKLCDNRELKANSSLIGDSKPVVDESNEPIRKSYEEHLVRLTENVTSKLIEVTNRLLEQWAIERAERISAEHKAKETRAKSEDAMRELRDHLERAERKF
ncbi:hypothetical protein FXO38_14578 [Capsicum annuum]|nr:hypothetical protein FXO38_14578 [Capsicum annuum]